jgi:hypothetical protein
MNPENKLALLIKLMIMDAFALTLIGIGIAKLQVNLDILPDSLRFPYSGWVFILTGIVLLVPTLILIFKFIRMQP